MSGKDDEDDESTLSLLDYYRPDIVPPPYCISTPTKGVFMEAVMGFCNVCEKV